MVSAKSILKLWHPEIPIATEMFKSKPVNHPNGKQYGWSGKFGSRWNFTLDTIVKKVSNMFR